MKALLARIAGLPRDKADTLLLLAGALLVLAPHAAHLPLWIVLLCGVTLLWRVTITLQGRRMPPSILLLPLAGAAMIGVAHTYQTLLGRDAGVAMLVLLVAFKMLEMHARRDLFVVVFLCFFLLLTNFFYEQGIATAMLTGVSLLALLTAQMSFQFAHAVPSLRQRMLMSAKLIGLAAPLALALFFFFPRIDGPLWGMPDDAAGARSGLSETMSPGTMANLAQSRDPAFRVRFDGAMPAPELLYWRGPVLGHYDGRTWTRLDARLRERTARQPLSLSQLSAAVNYEVTLEPTSSRWLFALEFPQSLPELDNNLASVSAEFELTATYPIDTRLRYRMTSYLGYRFRQQAMPDDAEYWLQLPEDSNPRALLAGLALRALGDPARRVDTVLQRFRREPYVYTLSPPLLGRDAVDDFLYGSRAGFCEHYAGAFVFLMRAAGVPARVVTGYQGGEANPLDGYVTVRQSDAHAWAEVWLGARGWVRVDPTAAVAPERVRSGIDAALPPRPPFGIAGLGRLMQFDGGNGWLAQLRHAAGAVNNGWNQWVLNYTPLRQRGVLEQVQASLLDWRLPAAVALLCAVLLLLRLFLRRRQNDPIDALYCALCTRLGRLGLVRGIDESPSSYAARVASAPALAPPVQAAAAEFLARYSAWRYAPRAPQAPPARAAPLAATLKRLLSQVR